MLCERAGSHPLIHKYNKCIQSCADLENQISAAEQNAVKPVPQYGNEIYFNAEEEVFLCKAGSTKSV